MAPGSMLVGLFVLIGFWALILPAGAEPSPSVEMPQQPFFFRLPALVLSAILLIGWVVWSQDVWGYYQDMREDEELYYKDVGEGMLPRFWFHGNFPR